MDQRPSDSHKKSEDHHTVNNRQRQSVSPGEDCQDGRRVDVPLAVTLYLVSVAAIYALTLLGA